jgi:uncharacterized protein (DUF1697 family)
MTTHVALLRAINVGGRNRVSMHDLRALLADIGLTNIRSLLQTGNVVFDSRGRSPAELERQLECAAADRLGLDTVFLVRTAREWREIVAANPFPAEAESGPGHLLVMPLKDAPAADRLAELEAAIAGREVIGAVDRQLYIVYPDGIGRSKLTTALIERKLTTQGTARNWNTVLKLASLLAPVRGSTN